MQPTTSTNLGISYYSKLDHVINTHAHVIWVHIYSPVSIQLVSENLQLDKDGVTVALEWTQINLTLYNVNITPHVVPTLISERMLTAQLKVT